MMFTAGYGLINGLVCHRMKYEISQLQQGLV
jgi:hypothetical protein